MHIESDLMDYTQPSFCLEQLRNLRTVDVHATHETLGLIIRGLLEDKPAPNQHLEVLEAAREALDFVQTELGGRYAARPLPPDGDENRTLHEVVALWQDVARSYAHIAERDADEGTLEDQRPLLAERRIFYAGLALFEYFRAHRALEPGMWHTVHEAYGAALHAGLAEIRVAEPLNETWHAQSPRETYVAILLVDLANPYGRSERELRWVLRWAQRFAPYCTLDEHIDEARSTTYGVELDSDLGLRPLGLLSRTATLLRFDGSTLATQIQAVMAQFRHGAKPASLGLGKDCSTADAGRLLLSLYRPWGLASAGRRFPRRNKTGEVALSGDWLAMGYLIQGEVFQQPNGGRHIGALRDDISLLTFGELVPEIDTPEKLARRRREQAALLGLEAASWTLLDQSVGGFRLQLLRDGDQARLEHHQLVAIRPPDGQAFLLADICWMMFRDDGALELGINVLAGMPRVVAARPSSAASRDPYHQAFLLPATPALKAAESVVLPAQWFRKARVVELRDGAATRMIELDKLLLRGPNFDQCSFTDVTGAAS